jgi:hypothetical protein
MTKKIFISGAHGSACSLLKSLAIGRVTIDSRYATCHESWTTNRTQKNDYIMFNHEPNRQKITEKWNPEVTIWLKINVKNVETICKRIVILDFLYVNDSHWMLNDWCWSLQKHQRLAGPDWPVYSTQISDYPTWCLDEMCHVAWERSRPWLEDRNDFDYVIDTDELFGNSPRVMLEKCFGDLGLRIDHDAVDKWKQQNFDIFMPYMNMFTWTKNWCPPSGWIPAPIDAEK